MQDFLCLQIRIVLKISMFVCSIPHPFFREIPLIDGKVAFGCAEYSHISPKFNSLFTKSQLFMVESQCFKIKSWGKKHRKKNCSGSSILIHRLVGAISSIIVFDRKDGLNHTESYCGWKSESPVDGLY